MFTLGSPSPLVPSWSLGQCRVLGPVDKQLHVRSLTIVDPHLHCKEAGGLTMGRNALG